ncbi:MAG: hypothetical protein VYC44_05365, partial [Chloroflexota bacterium]|nr:hypothetical protein [Chloroflexota bacterium]
ALIVRQGNVPVGGWKFEIRGYIANFCRHIFASMNLDLSALLGRPDRNQQIIPHYGLGDTLTRRQIFFLYLTPMIYLAALPLRAFEQGGV